MAPKADPKAKAKVQAAKVSPEVMAKMKAKREERPEDAIPKVEMPKKEEFEEKLQAVQDEIDKLQKQQQDLAKRISERSGGKDEYQTKRAELRAELDHWSGLLDGCRERKGAISAQLGEKKAEGQEMKSELNKMKKTIGFTSETEIDERIKAIEFEMHHNSISLKEEKKLMVEIQELKKNRPKVAGIKGLESKIAGDDRGGSLRDQSKAISEEMGRFLEEKRKVSEKLKELNELRKTETGDLPQLFEEREALSGKVRELSGKRNEIRAERRQKEQEYYAYQAEVRKVRQERAAFEREDRQKEYGLEKRRREAEKLDDQPHTQEITLIEQSIAFCNTLTNVKEAVVKEEKKEIQHTKMDGLEVMKKKGEDEEEYFVPKKKGKSKNKGAVSEGGSSKPIKHSAETFQLFSKLKLDAPITTADIPALLEKLEAQLADYQEKVKTWEKTKADLQKKILEGFTEEADKDEEKEKEAEKAEE